MYTDGIKMIGYSERNRADFLLSKASYFLVVIREKGEGKSIPIPIGSLCGLRRSNVTLSGPSF